MQKKSEGIRARLPPALRSRLDAIHERHGTNDTTVAIRLIEAFCDHVERTGKTEFPIQITTAPTPKAKSA